MISRRNSTFAAELLEFKNILLIDEVGSISVVEFLIFVKQEIFKALKLCIRKFQFTQYV